MKTSTMEIKAGYDIEHLNSTERIQHELWPLDAIETEKAKFPCCLVWTPLPVVSWLAPFIGHVGICREDGAVLDFSGSNFVNVDAFAFGSVARYLQLDRDQGEATAILICAVLDTLMLPSARNKCCFPPNLSGHTCKLGYRHAEYGTAITWDDALQSSMRHFEHKTYNLFTCNSHSYVANCLNRLCYGGSMSWNMINVGVLVLFKGHWVNIRSILRSFLPFIFVVCLGIFVVGWPLLIGLLSFSLLLIGWFLLGTYLVKNLLEC
ncbi:protein REVERSION-TO-ETHYLENE SENSITIVITY1 [Quillaja saponaria]|uniref:Protein REVERSION-TO-ETHYLENE SENSITIVITY1 n=1 Tax=Quillaja saponaria TaxID=32244 RepID=A0AAD7PJX3_QUISA|nr:protein REVERSION-TO-ETHYLENE SENSITIVITY1 [Quillaja saponaria]